MYKFKLTIMSLLIVMIAGSCIQRPYQPVAAIVSDYSSATVASVTFKWKVNGSNLDCIMSAPATGWVAVAFGSTGTNHGASSNLIIGYVDGSGTAHVTDENMSVLPHTPDTVQNILNISGTESGGTTEISFTVPMNSGDSQDAVMVQGQQYYLFTAYSSSDDITVYHDDRGTAQINL